ncbi:MAG: CHAT domain-containing protein [Methanothrix sp.]|nr:CHAT domain-containing protein [Methanothrix sp.]MDD4447986.1 CHAT domain-containing protein [Methanothrix sp.]
MKPENFLEAISALIQAKSEAEALQVLKDHPEILDDEADIMLRQLISDFEKSGEAEIGEMLKQTRAFLRTKRSSESKQIPSKKGLELSKILDGLSSPTHLEDMSYRIELCQRALELVSPNNTMLWAKLQNELGNSLTRSLIGNRADNIEQAIDHYSLALKVWNEKDYPANWAGIQNNLANAYRNRIRGDRADNIEQAIDHYSLALKFFSQKDLPENWAGIQNNLANAYRNRIRGDRADNIEQAIDHYSLALKISTEKDSPEQWAMTHNNLAIAYKDRILGCLADNIEQSIHHCSMALKVYTQKDFSVRWAMTQNNLASACKDRIRGDRVDNIEQAIDHYSLALKVYTQKDFPERWAVTHNNLAAAYTDRIRGDRADNIEQAMDHYSLALKYFSQKDLPENWAASQYNLANAYVDRVRGDRANNIEQAIHHYVLAMNVYTPDAFPNECRSAAYSLGNIYLEVQRFSHAKKAYSLSMSAAGLLYEAAIFQGSKDAELAETRSLYRRAGYAHARSNDAMKAVETLERGRARGLSLSLARDRADMKRVQGKDPQAYKDYWQAVADMQNLESQERVEPSAEGKALPQLRDLIMQARAKLSEALNRIRRIPGYESFLREAGWQDIEAAVIAGQPLVYLVAAPAGGVALIVHRHSESQEAITDLVNLDRFSEQRLQELLKIWFDAYSGWQEALENLRGNKISTEEYFQAQGRWFDAIEMVTGQLWQDVMEPIYGVVQSLKAKQVFLIPTGLLSLLPLHAAWHEEGGRRRYLLENLPVSYVPSARSLAHARRNAGAADRLLAIDEPRPVKASPLRNSNAEVSAISSLFKNRRILEHEKATRSAALQALPDVEVAHFSCHGGANWIDPEKSGLLMANNEILTVKDLFELHLAEARLATLSACETGVPGIKLPDEVVSLPSAFIRAGFAGAIGSLWTVSDESTAQLMTSFYQLWRVKDMSPVQALAKAQKRLRESEKFQHPFYWAAFYLTGV